MTTPAAPGVPLRDRLVSAGLDWFLGQQLTKLEPVATPAAGAEWSITVPGGVVWEILSFDAKFLTSAAVANRGLRLIADDGANTYLRIGSSAVVAATNQIQFSGGAGIGTDSAPSAMRPCPLPTPPLMMLPGHRLSSWTALIDTADQWSNIVVRVREWSPAQIAQAADQLIDRFATLIATL